MFKKKVTVFIAFGAVCIALAFALSFIRVWKMPQGGSVTAASMLPVMLFAYVFGAKKHFYIGLIVSFAYSMLQMIQDPYIVSFWQAVLDYPVAFGVLGLAGLMRLKPSKGYHYGLLVAVVVCSLLRFAAHTLSGVVFFAEYAGDQNVWAYSLGYNSFVLVECGICVAVTALLLANKSASKFLIDTERV